MSVTLEPGVRVLLRERMQAGGDLWATPRVEVDGRYVGQCGVVTALMSSGDPMVYVMLDWHEGRQGVIVGWPAHDLQILSPLPNLSDRAAVEEWLDA